MYTRVVILIPVKQEQNIIVKFYCFVDKNKVPGKQKISEEIKIVGSDAATDRAVQPREMGATSTIVFTTGA